MGDRIRTVLVLGAYGLIGSEVTRCLLAAGHCVIGLGRSRSAATRAFPALCWRTADLTKLTTPDDWPPLLADAETVVNAAGALQEGPSDRLEAVHHAAVRALAEASASAGIERIVQISAVGVDPEHPLAFYASKARGDAALLAGAVPAVILRPGLVLGPTAYGGSAMLRALAAFPVVQPVVLPETPVQTVPVEEVAHAVRLAVEGALPDGETIDLVEERPHSLGDVLAAHRRWLGLHPARRVVLPDAAVRVATGLADAAALLGWRSPVRGTALAAIAGGIAGDPRRWRELTGRTVPPLHEQLAARPAGVQERWFASLYLGLPAIIGTLSLFWLASGAVGLVRLEAAAALLAAAGWQEGAALTAALAGALLDLALGLAVLVRPWARLATAGMILVSAGYLVGATVWLPHLWADPLGPLVKVLPAMALAAVARILLVNR